MLIRSQNKKKITTDLNLEIYKPPYSDKYKINAGNVGYIGTYSTEEKAIKVLDMIQQKYIQYGKIRQGFSVEAVVVLPKVFQMPKDSEV